MKAIAIYIKSLYLLLTVMSFLASCSKDSENVETDVPQLDKLIPSQYLDEIGKHMSVSEENNPPIVMGTYYMETTMLIYSNLEDDVDYVNNEDELWNPMKIIITGQNKGIISYSTEEMVDDETIATSVADKAYIYGDGNNFTICAVMELTSHNSDNTVSSARYAFLISGTKESLGIRNMKFGFVMLEKSDGSDFIDVGGIRVFKELDGLAGTTRSNTALSRSIDLRQIRKRVLFGKIINTERYHTLNSNLDK